MIIGIAGYAQSGKDTFAQVLVENFNFERVAFADLLKQSLYILNPIVDPIVGFRVTDFVDGYGWEYAKTEVPEVRRLLQRLGTEVGRETLGPDIWLDAVFANMVPNGNYCISDMRFHNEAHRVVSVGGVTVRINRDGIGPANGHWGEVALDDWKFDHVVENNSDLDYLRAVADNIVN